MSLPNCPKCGSEYVYEDGNMLVCPECFYEWAENGEESSDENVVKDSNGNILQNGDSVTIIKDLKVKGASADLKRGTKVKNIKNRIGERMKSGFITIVGRPNVGKSTLMNKLVKEKVAIVSDKAGTTRDQIKGIVNIGENQFIFVDTPGIHKPKHLLGEHMTNVALEALENVDLIMFMLDGTQEISTGDMFVNENVRSVNTPIVLVINKIDKMTDEEIEEKKKEIREKLGEFDEIITLTAEYAIGIHKIFEVAEKYLSNDVWFYPEDYYTDLPVNKIVVETVREKILHHTKDEIPHSVAVEIINVETKPTIRKYDINIYVERDSQKGIIIGKDGAMLKKIGIEARREIEHLIDLKVNLKLWVKVKKKWRKNKKFLDEMGYGK